MAMPQELKLKLKKALGRVIAEGHPWIFKDALEGPRYQPGQVATVYDKLGSFVARGITDSGPIGLRVMTTRDEAIDDALFKKRIEAAAALRDRVIPPKTNAYRLLHGEGDRLPGVVCDVYAEYAVLQFDGQGMINFRTNITNILKKVLQQRQVNNLLVQTGRRKERSLSAEFGRLPEKPVAVVERAMRMQADLINGQKTGMFLDHRDSRWQVRKLAAGLTVLNLYGYTGGFSVAAGLSGAEMVETVDVAQAAIEQANQNWQLNGLDPAGHSGHVSDVAEFLTKAAARGARYDLIVADPPSFAPRESKVPASLRGYRALHRGALELLPKGGFYLAASCSSHINRQAFEKTILQAARQTDTIIQVLDRWGAPADHPRLMAFDEGDYLKVVLARIID
jgi:23S rRNA (cytosine1962-C5)-methyltransferase